MRNTGHRLQFWAFPGCSRTFPDISGQLAPGRKVRKHTNQLCSSVPVAPTINSVSDSDVSDERDESDARLSRSEGSDPATETAVSSTVVTTLPAPSKQTVPDSSTSVPIPHFQGSIPRGHKFESSRFPLIHT